MTKSRGILPPRRYWSDQEIELVRQRYADTPTAELAAQLGRPADAVYRLATKLELKKDPALLSAMARERSARPDHGGRATRFQKGLVPPNKGKKMPKGWAPGDMATTQFKKGHKPHTWVPVGSLTVNPDGILDQKVSEEPGPRHTRWKPVHRLVWERANGPVPEGHVVVFRPGRKTTDPALITLDALELIPRTELMKRNSFHNWPKPLEEVVLLRGRLQRQINKRAKEAEAT